VEQLAQWSSDVAVFRLNATVGGPIWPSVCRLVTSGPSAATLNERITWLQRKYEP